MNATLKPFIAILLAGLLLCACGSPAMKAEYGSAPPPKLPSIHIRPKEMYPDDPQAQALVQAARRGDVKEVDRLIDAGADPNAVGFGGVTVPGWVLFKPDKAGFRRLLERGADPNKIWYRGRYSQKSLMHMAVEQSPEIGVEYLRMCLEIGKGDPNLEPPDRNYRVLDEAVKPTHAAAFAILYKAGAKIDYVTAGFSPHTLVEEAALASNYKLTLFLLEQGVDYLHTEGRKWTIQYCIQNQFKLGGWKGYDDDPREMWFWRCVDWLEKRGMVFSYTPYEGRYPRIRPAVLDTTPPDILNVPGAKAAAPPKDIRIFMHQVHLTVPLPFWADTPETSENVQARQTQKPGIIALDYLPKGQTEADWKAFYTASTTYTPGTTLDEAVRLAQKPLRTGVGSDTVITSEETTADHHILRFALADASQTEGVIYIGRFMDTIVTVRAMWRNVDAATASAYRAKILSGMRQIVMKKGLTVLPAN